MIKVVPAIIPINAQQMTEEIELVSAFASLVQIDICDGIFAKAKTWPYNGNDIDFFEQLKTEKIGWPKWERVDVEVHLMVEKPEEVVLDWIQTGITSLVVHIEATNDMQKIIDMCAEHEVSLFIAIKPKTDIEKLVPFVAKVAGIQCMGSDALGHHGIELDPRVIPRIEKLHALYPQSIISVDIGVTPETKDELVAAGAVKLISGSAILDADDPEEMFFELSE